MALFRQSERNRTVSRGLAALLAAFAACNDFSGAQSGYQDGPARNRDASVDVKTVHPDRTSTSPATDMADDAYTLPADARLDMRMKLSDAAADLLPRYDAAPDMRPDGSIGNGDAAYDGAPHDAGTDALPDLGPDAPPDLGPDVRIYSCTLDDRLAAWNFDEDAGEIAADVTGNGHDLRLYGARWTEGISGSAIELDGDDYLTTENFPSFVAGDSLTLSAWMYVTEYDPNPGAGNSLFHLGRPSGEPGDYNYNLRFLANALQFNFLNEELTSGNTWQSSALYEEVNSWHALDITFRFGDASTMRVYYDGAPVEGSWSGDGSAAPFTVFPNLLTIGAYQQGGSFIQNFRGRLDNIEIYACELEAQQIRDRAGEFLD